MYFSMPIVVFGFAYVLSLLSFFISEIFSWWNMSSILVKAARCMSGVLFVLLYMPILFKQYFTATDQDKLFSVDILCAFNTILLASPFMCILVQFFIQFFFPYNMIGIVPNSRSTPIFVVCFWTPCSPLQNLMWTFPTGLFRGIFKHPHKSELYYKIGFINAINKEIVGLGQSLK